MLADIPDVDGPAREVRIQPEERPDEGVLSDGSVGLPVARMGLEHEFFLVDRRGEPRDLADLFLRECREAARAEGLDPRCFKAESVMGIVEITTPPTYGVGEMTAHYLDNLGLALGVASELGLALYPLGTYPLPISPVLRDDPSYAVRAGIIGQDRFSHAGRCAGAHLHLEVPVGTVWPDVKAALDAPLAAQRELLGLYNLATALDPALVALTRACPFYEGEVDGFAARTVHYRGILGFEGVYAGLREVGGLSAYAGRVEDLVDQQRARYRAWFAAMDQAGVERRLFARAGGNLHRASWNPVRLSHHGTVEIRSMDANFPEMVLALCALIHGAAERIRHERLEVRPARGVLALEPDGDLLYVPNFSYLNGELLGAAVTRGVQDQRVEAYVDSVMKFASPYLERPELVEPLVSSGGYKTTESEVLEPFPTPKVSLTREEGLSLVREACLRLKEQVSSLAQ
ncbi:MAG TPA: glutamate-cysteine ligase family protein, partial [Rubrobacter sp.]|nr:glutamate-cysteine ligase family protein [Rubrobacter sp.]